MTRWELETVAGPVVVVDVIRAFTTAAYATSAYSTEFPYTLIEMRMKPAGDSGEGKLLAQAGITTKNGRMELQNYGNAPIALTEITREEKKN